MALVLANRVQEAATANTTVSFTLTGAIGGFQSFAVIGDTNTTYYSATDSSGNWEVGLGTYSITGPTLTRTTVYASSNSGSAVTFSGSVNVFVTYPSGRSVNLDASGNVSALGTVASGTWQGTTVGVAYGGTGVTASSGANSVMLRDANQNVAVNRLNQSNQSTSAAGGTTALTAASSYSQTLTGTGNQTYTMPDATTLTTGVAFVFNNNATGTLTLQDYATGSIGTITSGGAVELVLLANGTTAGTWDVHGYIPENVTWGTNALALGSTVITGGTWNGGTIPTGYGGTGLTTFSAANNALYSTSSSALAAGTLPVAAGGTGLTSGTSGGIPYYSATSTLASSGALTANALVIGGGAGVAPSTTTTGTGVVTALGTAVGSAGAFVVNGGALGTPSSGTLTSCTGLPLTTGVTGTLPIANGGTGLTATPTNGQLDIGNGTGFTRAALTGTANQVTVTNGAGSITLSLPSSINVNTTGSAATLTTARAIYGNNFDGSAALTQIIASTYGGTGNGFTKFSGATTTEKTYTLPDATCSILTSNTAVTVAQGGTGATSATAYAVLCGGTTSTGAFQSIAGVGTSGQVLTSNGAGALPTFQTVSAGLTISDDTSTNATRYITFTSATSGSISSANVSSTKLTYNPSTGALSSTSHVSSSDETLKTNWRDVAPNFVEQLAGVKHGVFDRTDFKSTEVGVSAQSLQKVLEQAVVTGEDGMLSVNYGGAALVAAIKLAERVVALEARLAALEK